MLHISILIIIFKKAYMFISEMEEKMSIDCPVHGRVPGQKGSVHGQFEILHIF